MKFIYLGYVLQVEGTIGDAPGEFRITVGKGAQAKHQFRVGMEVSGQAVPVPDSRLETAGYYKASGLKILKDADGEPPAGPPFHGVPPDLEAYRSRGHRRLDARTYDTKCTSCDMGYEEKSNRKHDSTTLPPHQRRYVSNTLNPIRIRFMRVQILEQDLPFLLTYFATKCYSFFLEPQAF